MKIQCGVCEKEEASVFCPSDEAALCDGCDRHVHSANKLAGNHRRLSLLQCALAESPLCHVCQVKRAILFCREDRAILCRECDVQIHRASQHTHNHSRYLLTGLKLSSNPPLPQTSDGAEVAPTTTDAESRRSDVPIKRDGVWYLRSSISEYLESLPGWCVEEFLDPPSATATNVFCRV